MAWTIDRNGMKVWVDDGAPRASADPWGAPDYPAGGVPVPAAPVAPGPRSAAGSPFATSLVEPGVVSPVQLPPVTVEATRLPQMPGPVVGGVTVRRVAPGAGYFGERGDMVEREVRRDRPMTVREGDAAGLIDVYAGGDGRGGQSGTGIHDPLPAGPRAFDMEMRSPDALAMRQGFRDESAARRDAARIRATGRVGGSKDIVAKILGGEEADAAGGRRMREEDAASGRRMREAAAASGSRMREARVTPQVRDGAVYDPVTGVSQVPNKGAARPTRWEDYTPKELGDMVNAAVRSMMPEGDSAAFRTALLTAKTDTEKESVYKQFSARPTPAQQLVMDKALEQLRLRGGEAAGAAGGAKAAGGGQARSWRDVVKN